MELVLWCEETLHLHRVEWIDRAGQDGAGNGCVVFWRAEKAVEHSSDAAEFDPGFVGDVDDEWNALLWHHVLRIG